MNQLSLNLLPNAIDRGRMNSTVFRRSHVLYLSTALRTMTIKISPYHIFHLALCWINIATLLAKILPFPIYCPRLSHNNAFNMVLGVG